MSILKPYSFPLASSMLVRVIGHKPLCPTILRHLTSSQVQPQQTSTNTSCGEFKHASLSDRSVIRVTGAEASTFLQGIITNDINQLCGNNNAGSRRCIYTFMLGNTGRIIADLFVYSIKGESDDFLLEVDSKVAPHIGQLLKRYKIRRKISVKPEENCRITAIYPESPETVANVAVDSNSNEQLVVQDPRSHHFGYRVLSLQSSDPASILSNENEHFNGATLKLSYGNDYRRFRYRLGIGEGVLDFPPEAVFPFEANAELLNAVSFSKGCYIGQELTARTYHTGVIRKRLLPIELLVDDTVDLSESFPVQNVVRAEEATDDDDAPKKIMGRFRVNFGRAGLATLKHAELFDSGVNSCDKLKLDKSGHLFRTWRPFWWPEEIYQKFNQKF